MKKISFIGFPQDSLVEVLHEGQEERSCGANEVPFPAFLLSSQATSESVRVQPVFDAGMCLFGVGLTKPHAIFPDEFLLNGQSWTFDFVPAPNGLAVNLELYCPDDTTLEWLKDAA